MRRPHGPLLALLLTFGWSAAQTGTAQTSVAQPSAAQTSPVPTNTAQPGAAQTAPSSATTGLQVAPASAADGLISALKKSFSAEARGEAVLELVFPPNARPLRGARSLPRLSAVPALIRRNFAVVVQQDTLAGRPARRYTLTPQNPQAARWVIWVDQQWNVPLAYQERMPDGTLARRAELTTVKPGLARLAQADPLPTLRPALRRALLAALPGLKLPAGFEPLSVQQRSGTAGSASPSVEVLLGDGLNVLALVVSPRPVKSASGVSVRQLSGQGGRQSVWLVGNLPQAALDSALAAIRQPDFQAVGELPGTFGDPTASDQ